MPNYLFAVAILVTACGGQNEANLPSRTEATHTGPSASATHSSDESQIPPTYIYKTDFTSVAELPACTTKNHGELFQLAGDTSTYYCDGQQESYHLVGLCGTETNYVTVAYKGPTE